MEMYGYHLNSNREWVKIKKPFKSKEDGLEYAFRKGYVYFKLLSWDDEKKVEVISDDD